MFKGQENNPITGLPMTPREIRSAMILAGVTNSQIAKALNVTPSAISAIIGGFETSRRVQEAVAQAINKSFVEVWGDKVKTPRKKRPIVKPLMEPQEIRAHLLLNHKKNIDIAKELGIHPAIISSVINGHRNCQYVQEAIAKAINKEYKDVWGKKIA